MSEQFQHSAWPARVTSALWLNGSTFPVQFSLNPEAVVTVTCEGDVEVVVPGVGSLTAHPGGSVSFRTDCMGIQVEAQTAQLILEAADAQGIEVAHRCAPHHSKEGTK